MEKQCGICFRDVKSTSKHHIKPKSRGGKNDDTVPACKTCHRQVHALYTEKELALMSFEDLLKQPDMSKYLKWIRGRKGEFKAKRSKRRR